MQTKLFSYSVVLAPESEKRADDKTADYVIKLVGNFPFHYLKVTIVYRNHMRMDPSLLNWLSTSV